MENPFIGKRADVLNKKGIVSLFHRKQYEHESNQVDPEECWMKALELSDRHFDSQFNLSMYRWSTGQISESQLTAELADFFSVPNKGKCLWRCPQKFKLVSSSF